MKLLKRYYYIFFHKNATFKCSLGQRCEYWRDPVERGDIYLGKNWWLRELDLDRNRIGTHQYFFAILLFFTALTIYFFSIHTTK